MWTSCANPLWQEVLSVKWKALGAPAKSIEAPVVLLPPPWLTLYFTRVSHPNLPSIAAPLNCLFFNRQFYYTMLIIRFEWVVIKLVYFFLIQVPYDQNFNHLLRQRSWHSESTALRPISKVKQCWVWSVLGWVTSGKHYYLLAFACQVHLKS